MGGMEIFMGLEREDNEYKRKGGRERQRHTERVGEDILIVAGTKPSKYPG